MLFEFIILLTLLVAFITSYLRYRYTYWNLLGVAQFNPHFLLGTLPLLQSVHFTELIHELYTTFKGRGCKVVGTYIFTQPIAVILDLDTIKLILIKEFNKFIDRNKNFEDPEPIQAHLFNMQGEKWRVMRNKLTSTFTSGKMKIMFPNMLNVAKQLELACSELVEKSPNGVVELHDVMGRYTTDVIGACVFGVECNSLKDPDVEFRRIGRRVFYTDKSKSVLWEIFRKFNIKILKWFGARNISRDVRDFILRVVYETVKIREQQQIRRNDFLNLLIDLKDTKNGNDGLTVEQMAAQAFLFFIAGFETSSSNMSYGLFELAKNPLVQERLRKEILEVLERYNGEVTYEAINEVTYLDQTITETVRKYPALSVLTRISSEDLLIPGTKIKLEKGIRIFIPAREIHYDPDIYEKPFEFNPDRFTSDQLQYRHPQAFLGFGDGPRNCIGLRFGRMQTRIGLITLLKSFRFSISERTPAELELSKFSSVVIPGNKGVWLKVEKL